MSRPGNVRELEHVIERAVVLGRGPVITLQDLPPAVRAPAHGAVSFVGEVMPVRDLQRRYAAWAFERLGSRKMLTAEKLGIDAKTLSKWLGNDNDPERGT